MLSTAESLLGVSRHLSAYADGPDRSALGQLEFAGKTLDVALRLRGTGVSTFDRVLAMALDVGVAKRHLVKEVLPALETLNLITIDRSADRKTIVTISERIPPIAELFALADSLLQTAMPEPVELATLRILDRTTVMPLTVTAALEEGAAVSSDEEAERALAHLEALHLCTVQMSADGHKVVFNPNIWSADVDHSKAALRAEDGAVRAALSGLLEEVAASAGMPQDSVKSAETKWIDFAVAHGLLQRSIVTTTEGVEKAFLFAPHMGRSAFDEPTGPDPSGHVRQLIGSMIFAQRYAEYRLTWPATFLRRLVERGISGESSPIGTDYPMLEKAGIVRVEKAQRWHRFVLLKTDVAEEAISYLDNVGGPSSNDLRGLRNQHMYRPPESERARRRADLARSANTHPRETERLLAALRQELGNRRYER